MVYKTFRVNSKKISANNSISLKEELKDLIPFSNFEGHYGGKVDGLEDTIGVFLIPIIYFPSSSRNQISTFKDINADLDVKIKKSDIESYFNQVSILDDIFETDLTVGTYVENTSWVLKEDHCKFLGTSEDKINIEQCKSICSEDKCSSYALKGNNIVCNSCINGYYLVENTCKIK